MAIHDSNVNFRNLIRDLKDMYTYDVSEVIVTELVANSLDAHSTRIMIDYEPNKKILIITDNGDGMTHDQFIKYHDLAAGTKSRGTGIGFAGVGAKISFNIADLVITETRSNSFEGGSKWQLLHDEGNDILKWEDIIPSHLIGHGTRIEIHFSQSSQIQYNTTQELNILIKRHYLPLLDHEFLNLYSNLNFYEYLNFYINGDIISPINIIQEFKLDNIQKLPIKKSNKLIGYGIFGLSQYEYPLGEDFCGILISVHGKIIKSELFNQFPGKEGPRIFGLVEVPELVKFVNTAKNDFIRSRGKLKEFE